MPSDGTEARDLGDFAVEWAQELSRLAWRLFSSAKKRAFS
jgi:hypothetical protein